MITELGDLDHEVRMLETAIRQRHVAGRLPDELRDRSRRLVEVVQARLTDAEHYRDQAASMRLVEDYADRLERLWSAEDRLRSEALELCPEPGTATG